MSGRSLAARLTPFAARGGDRKWVRNLTVAKILRHHLAQLAPTWPPPEEGVAGLVVD